MRRGRAGAGTGRRESQGEPGQEAHGLAAPGRGCPRTELEALEWAAWRQPSP